MKNKRAESNSDSTLWVVDLQDRKTCEGKISTLFAICREFLKLKGRAVNQAASTTR